MRCFFKGILTKPLVLKSDSCAEGKMAKDRLTVLMCGSMAGEIWGPYLFASLDNHGEHGQENIMQWNLP